MMRRAFLLLAMVAACAPPKSQADTTVALTPPDTLKPATPVVVSTPDTTPARATATKTKSSGTQSAGTKATKAKILPRDSVIDAKKIRRYP